LGLIGILFLALVQLMFFAGLVFLWMRMKRSMDDDSRWSRSLQFLQSKIAVFEDLSDRTETQVKQLTLMMENKICDLQRKIDEADEILNKISNSMKKSIEVAQIFQDKIPHEEIIERQNTVKFVKAALLANEGKAAEEIAQTVDLPIAQIEFIVKVNSDRLSFDASQIPEWLKSELNKDPLTKHSLFEKKKLERISDGFQTRSPLRPIEQVLKNRAISAEFEPAIPTQAQPQKPQVAQPIPIADSSTVPVEIPTQSSPIFIGTKSNSTQSKSASDLQATQLAHGALIKKAKDMGIRPVVFPRIDMPR
jgi:hypothetical protein